MVDWYMSTTTTSITASIPIIALFTRQPVMRLVYRILRIRDFLVGIVWL
jgi:hypothetical protein